MPTTASSNNPHVRITRSTHEKVKLLAFALRSSQTDLIELLVSEKLAEIGSIETMVGERLVAANTALPTEVTRSEEVVPEPKAPRRRRSTPAPPVEAPPPGRRRGRPLVLA